MENNWLKELKYFIVGWNNKFPYDKMFRQKYNIPFNSDQHRKLSQIDIFIEILEDKLIESQYSDRRKREELLKDYKDSGEFLIDLEDKLTEDDKDDFFKKLMNGIKKVNDKP